MNDDPVWSEWRRDGLGPEVLAFLGRIVKSVAVTYPPLAYAGVPRWDADALDELLQSWLDARLIGRKDLARLFEAAERPAQLRAMLVTNLKWHLAGLPPDAAGTQLASDVRAALRTRGFVRIAGSGRAQDDLYALADHVADAVPRVPDLNVRTVAVAAARKPLADALAEILDTAQRAMTFAELVALMRYGRSLPPIELIELPDEVVGPDSTATEALDRLDTAAIEDAASSVLARLDPRLLRTVAAVHAAEGRARDAAHSLGVAPSTVYRQFTRVLVELAIALGEPEAVRHNPAAAHGSERLVAAWHALVALLEQPAGT